MSAPNSFTAADARRLLQEGARLDPAVLEAALGKIRSAAEDGHYEIYVDAPFQARQVRALCLALETCGFAAKPVSSVKNESYVSVSWKMAVSP